MLTGDFNARTGCEPDFADVDQCIHIAGDYHPPLHTPRRRKNFDSQVNEHGKSLLEICKACDLRILNGRTTGDSFGQITFHSPKGISTVDYFIVSHVLMNSFGNLIVKDPTIFSDHSAQLICWATISSITRPQTTSHPEVHMFNDSLIFQTSNESFLDALEQEDFVLRLSLFENTSFTSDSKGKF